VEVTDPNPIDLLPELGVQMVILTIALETLNKQVPPKKMGNKRDILGMIKLPDFHLY